MKGFKLSMKEISWLQVIFVLIWIKQMLIWFKLQRDGTGNGFLTSRMLFQNVCSYKFQFCTPEYVHLQGWSLKYDGWAKYKEKVPDMLKQHAIPNSSLHNLRFIHKKGAEKLAKDELLPT